jgi:hypothetical protein
MLAQFLSGPNDLSRLCASAIVSEGRLGSIKPPKRDGMEALRQAMLATRELFLLCGDAEAVKLPLFKAKSKRFPRFFLTERDGSALSQSGFKDFLAGEVQYSAMTLIAGELQLRDLVFASTVSSQALDDAVVPGGGFPRILRQQILQGATPDRHVIVKWLLAEAADYRVRFNLSCYFSREILVSDANAIQTDAIWAKLSLEQLSLALASCSPETKANLAKQAMTDPALVGLRVRANAEFKSLVDAAGGELRPNPLEKTDDALEDEILGILVPDTVRARRLKLLLSRMLPPTGRMVRRELLGENSWSVQQVEEFMAFDPGADHSQDPIDREMLTRLLFLPMWTGGSISHPPVGNK